MKKLFLLLILSFFSAQGLAGGSVKSSDINFPGSFYTKEIESCSAMAGTPTFNYSTTNRVKGLIGYDWHSDWEANSYSSHVEHENITVPMMVFMAATHNAIGNDNQANINIAKNLLLDLAKADTLYDSIGFYEVRKKPLCYANGDKYAPCWYHQYQFARDVFANYMIAALWLKDELNTQELETVDKYINKMYKKFLKPDLSASRGFYAMANGGIAILVYASWTNNKKLAAEEINFRFNEMDRLFFNDGYIDNNSFRGYKSQWYHSYGLNIALGYVYIADLWGAEVPEKLQKKLVKASEVTNLAIADWDKFTSRKFSGDSPNKLLDKSDAEKNTHPSAFAIDTLMKLITGVELAHDPVYLSKRKWNMNNGIDETIGFNPNCTHAALALANSPEELAKKTAAEKAKLDAEEKAKAELEADLELPIFDDVHYQLEGQILKINIGDMVDPKMEPLKRHRDSLQKKCGSGLIDQSGWLSFVSSDSYDWMHARNQNCHYNYFQKSNDKQAFELFQAVLGGTDSILDYLETNVEK